eukprot:COSAG01_NODE_6491_length_3633_cov_4.622241_2_plen_145_part_00
MFEHDSRHLLIRIKYPDQKQANLADCRPSQNMINNLQGLSGHNNLLDDPTGAIHPPEKGVCHKSLGIPTVQQYSCPDSSSHYEINSSLSTLQPSSRDLPSVHRILENDLSESAQNFSESTAGRSIAPDHWPYESQSDHSNYESS